MPWQAGPGPRRLWDDGSANGRVRESASPPAGEAAEALPPPLPPWGGAGAGPRPMQHQQPSQGYGGGAGPPVPPGGGPLLQYFIQQEAAGGLQNTPPDLAWLPGENQGPGAGFVTVLRPALSITIVAH